MVYVSAGSRLAFGRQTAMKTKVAQSRFLGITNQGIDLPDLEMDVKEYDSFGVGRDGRFALKLGREQRLGSLPFVPTTGEMFYYLWGQDTFTAGTPNIHVLSAIKAAELPWFSLGVALEGSPNFLREYVGCVMDSMSLSLSEAGELQVSAEVMAYDTEDAQPATGSLFAQPDGAGQVPYMFWDVAPTAAAGNVAMASTYDFTANTWTGGRTIAAIRGFNCNWNNNMKGHWFKQANNPRKPFIFTTGKPTFSLSIDVVPSGSLSADVDSLYDMLKAGTQGDIVIPFYRSATDRLDLVFDDCIIRAAPHGLNEDGGEVSVTANVVPEKFRVVVRDSIAQYSTL